MKIKNLWRQKYLMLHYFHKNTFLTVIRYEFLIGSHFYKQVNGFINKFKGQGYPH